MASSAALLLASGSGSEAGSDARPPLRVDLAGRRARWIAENPPVPVRRATEAEILLQCARKTLAPGNREVLLTALGREVDWPRLHALARRNGMIALLARHLGSVASDAVPADVLDALRAEAADDARRSLRLSAELVRLLALFASGGVRACAYKGPALAVRAYGDLGLRRFSDLDILVHPDDADGAMRVLAARGYVPRFAFTPRQDRVFRRTDGDYPYHHPETGTLVELHTHVSPARFVVDLPTEELLARTRPVRVGGGDVPALADDDLFLALAVHGAKHRWERLEWVAAVAELIRGGSIDIPRVLERATAIGARRTVLLALHMAGMLGLAMPDEVRLEAIVTTTPLADEAERRIFRAPSDAGAEEETTAANLMFNLRARDGAADRLRYAWRWLTVPSPEDWDAVRLPDALFPAYRAIRPVRLLARYGARALRRR